MSALKPTVILRHKKENLKKCSLRGLEPRSDFIFLTYPKSTLPSLKGYVLLTMGAPPLTKEDHDKGIFLIDGTILENITLNRDLPIDKTLEKVCKQARLSDFINSLPNGLETSIGERGIRLSGGQIQRIGIARALYKNPSILILDEATSSLDNVTEKEIIESIDCLDDQLTIITIAHRLTTLSFCNKIVQMDQGIVAKIGHYEDIVLKNKLS